MVDTYNGRKRIRKQFGSIGEVAEMPNLIEVQKSSYDDFLMVKEPPGGRAEQGLQAVFKSVFPISDFSGRATLDFERYDFELPKYDVDECQQRDMTFAAPLKVKLSVPAWKHGASETDDPPAPLPAELPASIASQPVHPASVNGLPPLPVRITWWCGVGAPGPE